MKSLLPLFPFVAALSLLACQGDDGPVAEGASVPPNAVVDGSIALRNAAAAEAADLAAVPGGDEGMRWTAAAGGAAHYGPQGARPQLVFACEGEGSARRLVVTRAHPATAGNTGTLSFTGGGNASSLPMVAVAKAGGPGESEWQGEARGDMARAVARAFSGAGRVDVTLGGAPALAVPVSPLAKAVLARCA